MINLDALDDLEARAKKASDNKQLEFRVPPDLIVSIIDELRMIKKLRDLQWLENLELTGILYDMQEEAEFEAKVAKCSLEMDVEIESANDAFGKENQRGWAFSMLKRCRIAVEEEMEDRGAEYE